MTQDVPEGGPEPMAALGKFKYYAMIAVPVVLAAGAYTLWQSGKPSCSSSGAQNLVTDIAKEKGLLLFALESDYRAGRVKQTAGVQEDPQYQSLIARKQQIVDKRQQAVNICEDDAQHPSWSTVIGRGREIVCESTDANGPDLSRLLPQSSGPPISCDPDEVATDLRASTLDDPEHKKEDCLESASYRHYYDYARVNIYPLNAEIAQVDAQIKAISDRSTQQEQATEQSNENLWRKVSQSVKWSLENIITTDKNESTGSVACKAVLNASVDEFTEQSSIKYTIEKNSNRELYATVWIG